MFVGGEFYYDRQWLTGQQTVDTSGKIFLNGGRACLTVIADYLRSQGINEILLPAYLCPSILDVLEQNGLSWNFYQVNEDFSIDVEDLLQKAADFQAVYFITYFGFSHTPEALAVFKSLQQSGVIVIEDNAQAGFASSSTGDFCFNSFRKLVPYDGGYLTTNREISQIIAKYRALPNPRLPLIRAYRKKLFEYLVEEKGSYRHLVALYAQAEHHYAADLVVEGDPEEQRHIERLDWAGIRRTRWENYCYLMGCIAELSEITPIFPNLPEGTMPLGLPVYLNGAARDPVYEHLGKSGIGLFIHWEELRHDPRTNGSPLAVSMASRILTLTIDQRTSHKQLDYQVRMLKEGIAQAKRR